MSLRLPSQNKAFKPTKPKAQFRRPSAPASASKPGAEATIPRRPLDSHPPALGSSQGPTQATTKAYTQATQASTQPSTQSTVIATPASKASQRLATSISPTISKRVVADLPPTLATQPLQASSQVTLVDTQAPKSVTSEAVAPTPSSPPPLISNEESHEVPPSFTQEAAPKPSGPSRPKTTAQSAVSRSTPAPALRVPPSPRGGRQPSVALSTTSTSISRSGRSALLQAAEAHAASGFSKPSPGRIPHRSRSASVATHAVALIPPENVQVDSSATAPIAPEAGPSSLPTKKVSKFTPARPSGLPPTLATVADDPSPASSRSGLPPTLATGSSSGLPPTLATSPPHSPSSRSTSLRPSESPEDAESGILTPAELAARAVAGITRKRGSGRPLPRRKGLRDKQGHGIKTSKRVYRDKLPPLEKKKKVELVQREEDLRRKRKADRGSDETDDSSSEEETGRRVYASAGKAGTELDRRTSKYRKKQTDQPTFTQADLDGLEPGTVVGDPIDVNALTMADLATTGTHGKVSQRGLELHSFTKTVQNQKKRQRISRLQIDWKRKQIQRRYLRDQRNKEKEAQRQVYRDQGKDPALHVEEDEPHSEEEYEVIPDRLTPPEEPERYKRIQPISIRPTQNEHEHVPREEGQEVDEEDAEAWNENMGNGNGDDEEVTYNLDDLEDPEEYAEAEGQEGGEGNEDEDQMRAQLLAAGFTINDNAEEGAGEGEDLEREGENEDSDGEAIDWSQYQNNNAFDSVQDYRDHVARQREQNMEMREGQYVEEVDDATKMVNSVTYRRYYRNAGPMKWDKEDTEMFYEVLRQTGENISLMTAFFPGRDHRNLKNKYMREKEKNSDRLNQALLNRKPLDTDFLKKSAGFDVKKNKVVESFLETTRREAERIKSGIDPNTFEEEEAVAHEAGEGEEAVEGIEEVQFEDEPLFMEGEEGVEDMEYEELEKAEDEKEADAGEEAEEVEGAE